MKPKRILVLYKQSAYKFYFLGKNSSFLRKQMKISPRVLSAFKKAHVEHYKTLEEVLRILRKNKIKYVKRNRGKKTDFKGFDFVVSVGGDGTFLEAARGIKEQVILGVNSDPVRSFGRYCAANRDTFEKVFGHILKGRGKILPLNRIEVRIGSRFAVNALNDTLICHANPAALSRYLLVVGAHKEEQRSSGLWISTASGSSGAIKSAGGKVLPMADPRLQYHPRELIKSSRLNCQLTGGVLKRNQSIKIQSLMRRGMIYVDGTHVSFPFHFGDVATFSKSPYPIKVIYDNA